MGNPLKTISNKIYFSLKRDSNYKVMMTYDRSEVIEFDQFKKLLKTVNDSDVNFVTINQRVVKKSTIIDMSPTSDRTELQKKKSKDNPVEVVIVDEKGNPVKLSELIKERNVTTTT